LDDKKLKHKVHVEMLKDRIATLEGESDLDRMVHQDKHDVRKRESGLQEKYDHLKWLNSLLKDKNKKLKEKVSILKKQCEEEGREHPVQIFQEQR